MPEPLYELKITVLDVEPTIWRTLLVSPEIKLDRLHLTIQAALNWEDYHLYEFSTREGQRFGLPDPDEKGLVSSRRVALAEVMDNVGDTLVYNYDFGDDWFCHVRLEKLTEPDERTRWPVCLAGERNAPPEDCGGPFGYTDWLKQLKGPSARDRREAQEVLGPDFDPEAFDIEKVNLSLRQYAPRPRRTKTN